VIGKLASRKSTGSEKWFNMVKIEFPCKLSLVQLEQMI